MTQSTLSAGIRELETLLDASLVERTRRVVRFTPLGERIAEKARRVLADAEDLAALAHAESKPLTGDLRMGVIPTIAPFLLPRILPRLRTEYPSLRLFLREEPSAAACEALHKGQVDCVLLALPYGCGDIEAEILFEDRFFVAAHKDDEVVARNSVKAGAIDGDQLLLLEDGHCLKEHALAACKRPEFRTEASVIGTSLHTLIQMVDNRLGLTLVPQMALDAGILSGTEVVARPLAEADAAREIALVWRRSSPREDEFRMLAKALVDAGGADA
ncbi:LysR family hydrogen peroxide-inducible transcriptional activator [Pacificimonas flava]|nr:LysR family hydrogen peroxide-inducible transcriptional activator [Pacificimonas flava]